MQKQVLALSTDLLPDLTSELQSLECDVLLELFLSFVLFLKWVFASHHAKQNDAQAPDIGLEVAWLLQDELRSHECKRAALFLNELSVL